MKLVGTCGASSHSCYNIEYFTQVEIRGDKIHDGPTNTHVVQKKGSDRAVWGQSLRGRTFHMAFLFLSENHLTCSSPGTNLFRPSDCLQVFMEIMLASAHSLEMRQQTTKFDVPASMHCKGLHPIVLQMASGVYA